MKAPFLSLLIQGWLLSTVTGQPHKFEESNKYPGLEDHDCQIRCPKSSDPSKVILPAISEIQNATGGWENIVECWQVASISTVLPGIDNAYRLDWEDGFDLGYQYIFYGESFMQAHSTPVPSLIVVGGGIGEFCFVLFSFFFSSSICCSRTLRLLVLVM